MHEMDGEYVDSDTIIWTCPICGRVILMRGHKTEVKMQGDSSESHRGGIGLQIGSVEIAQDDQDDLGVWRGWADEIDLPYCLDNDDASQH